MKKILSAAMALSLAVGGAVCASAETFSAADIADGDIVVCAGDDSYVKLGEIGALGGYTLMSMENAEDAAADYFFTPDDEGSHVLYVSVGARDQDAETLLGAYQQAEDLEMTEAAEVTIQGHKAYVFSYTDDYYDSAADADAAEGEAPEDDPPSNTFEQEFVAFVDIDGENTLCLHIDCESDSADFYLPAEEVQSYLSTFTGCFRAAE